MALSLEKSLQFIEVYEVPTTTTTAPTQYFLTVYSESPWPERLPNSGTALSLETSSQFSQVGELMPADTLVRTTAMAARCAYRVQV